MPGSRVTAVQPFRAIEGGRVTIHGADFPVDQPHLPEVRIGERRARVVYASPSRLAVIVPTGVAADGRVPVRIEGVSGETAYIEVAAQVATGLHQVDNPVIDAEGNLYVTYSGTRETFSSGIVNPTSMALDAEGRLYVSSRFEGTVYRLDANGEAQPFATDLGIACGLAFAADGSLFVGDRSGTIFKVDRGGHAIPFAALPASVAAFHLALGPDQTLYVTGPTFSTYDVVYHIDRDGAVTPLDARFGRPHGVAFDRSGALFVIEALAGDSGVYRVPIDGAPELVVAGPGLVGIAFDRRGGVVVCSNDTAHRLPPPS